MGKEKKPLLSIVIPVFNEEENLVPLHSSLVSVLDKIIQDYEVLFVDDGSTDKSPNILHELFNKDHHVRVIEFRRRFGQSAALDAAFAHAKGNIIITIDADQQNDPEDIPNILEKLKDYDVVCGWRTQRQDPLTKRIPSKIYNWLARRILQTDIHDLNCGLRGFRKETIVGIELLGEMHRYLPVLTAWRGFKITEIKVQHSPRKRGKSKYGFPRLVKGFIDMLTVKFLTSYSASPAYILGLSGILVSMIGFISGLYLVAIKFLYNIRIGERPLLLLSILLMIIGVQMLSFGLISEVTSRVFYRVSERKPYVIREILEHRFLESENVKERRAKDAV